MTCEPRCVLVLSCGLSEDAANGALVLGVGLEIGAVVVGLMSGRSSGTSGNFSNVVLCEEDLCEEEDRCDIV